MTLNILTDRQRCARECRATHWRIDGISPSIGDARRCEHGRWWVATGRQVESTYYLTLDVWRSATWSERRRACQAEATR